MMLTRAQISEVLDSHFGEPSGFAVEFLEAEFNRAIIDWINNTGDLLDEVRNTNFDPRTIAFTAFAELARDLVKNRYPDGYCLSFQTAIANWCRQWLGFNTCASIAINWIETVRASTQKEKEDTTMKNTDIENIVLTEEEERFCAECGCVIEGEGHEVDGDWYCDDCFNEQFVECAHCGEIIRKNDAFEYEGDYYCEDCRNYNFAYCEICDEYHWQDDMTWIESEDRYVCDDCLDENFTRCGRCGDWVRNGDVSSVIVDDSGNTEEWCENCIEWHTWRCDQCEELFSDDVDHDEDDDDNWVCSHCSGSVHCDTGDINTWVSPRRRMNYGFKPIPCMCATKGERDAAGPDWDKKIVFYGYELEIDRREKCYEENAWSEKIVDELTSTYCKQDCSLDKGGDYSGIEIVSHPATVAWYMEHKADFERCFEMLKEGGWLSHDAGTCGLHVHISLHPMEDQNPFAVHNMLILYDRFWDKLVKFSRRTESQLAHWAKHYSTAHGTYEDIKNMAKRECGRYMAVNLTNKHTVEIRMFRGTLNLETFFATLQLVDVITKKCIEIGNDSRKVQSIAWEELIESDYEELNSYMQRRGLLPGAVELPEPPENEESARELARESQQFHVGDRVRVCDDYIGYGASAIRGEIGTIAYIRGDNYAVELDRPYDYCHDCDGRTAANRGIWFTRDALDVVDDPFIPGMCVQVNDTYYNTSMRGQCGIIVGIDTENNTAWVQFMPSQFATMETIPTTYHTHDGNHEYCTPISMSGLTPFHAE